MKIQEEIKAKIEKLKEKIEELEEEFHETLEDEEVDEFSEKGEELVLEYEDKKRVVEEQIELLEWVLE